MRMGDRSFPVLLNGTAAMLDPDMAGGAIGYIAAVGQCGSALFPFITGALSARFGVEALQPLSVVLIGLLACLWAAVMWLTRKRWARAHRF